MQLPPDIVVQLGNGTLGERRQPTVDLGEKVLSFVLGLGGQFHYVLCGGEEIDRGETSRIKLE